MSFRFGFAYWQREDPYAKAKWKKQVDRLTKSEWATQHQYFPFMCMSLCIGSITKTSVPILVERCRINSYTEYINLALYVARCIDSRDDEKWRKKALAYRKNQQNDPRELLEYWFLDRFEGWSVNVATEPDSIWRKGLRKKFHDKPPESPPKFSDVVYREANDFYTDPEVLEERAAKKKAREEKRKKKAAT